MIACSSESGVFFLDSRFDRRLPLGKGRVHKDRDWQITRMLHNQWIHNRSCHASHSYVQFRHRKALHFAFLKLVFQPPQTMPDVGKTGLPRTGPMTLFSFLSKQVDNPNSSNTSPNPEFSRLGVCRACNAESPLPLLANARVTPRRARCQSGRWVRHHEQPPGPLSAEYRLKLRESSCQPLCN